jgi:hypothetical protein
VFRIGKNDVRIVAAKAKHTAILRFLSLQWRLHHHDPSDVFALWTWPIGSRLESHKPFDSLGRLEI